MLVATPLLRHWFLLLRPLILFAPSKCLTPTVRHFAFNFSQKVYTLLGKRAYWRRQRSTIDFLSTTQFPLGVSQHLCWKVPHFSCSTPHPRNAFEPTTAKSIMRNLLLLLFSFAGNAFHIIYIFSTFLWALKNTIATEYNSTIPKCSAVTLLSSACT